MPTRPQRSESSAAVLSFRSRAIGVGPDQPAGQSRFSPSRRGLNLTLCLGLCAGFTLAGPAPAPAQSPAAPAAVQPLQTTSKAAPKTTPTKAPTPQDPLAAIDWLATPAPDAGLPGTVLLEPPVADTARRPEITVTPLASLVTPIGLVKPASTGLPVDLWRGSNADEVAALLASVHVQKSPAMQSLMFTLLLSETRPPVEGGETLLLARLDRLMDLGAPDPTQALAEQADPDRTKARFKRWFDATLLTGDEQKACITLQVKPHLAPDYAARIFCAARLGDWPTAALLLEAAHALELVDNRQLDLLDRFLNPDIFEDAAPLRAPKSPDPLTFRLYETIGERRPTANLPRAFAAADLRDVAGWKAQLEAAERLARIGALNPNHLLGLYSARSPAASGGIWDRVAALQRFETALETGSSEAVSKTLPKVWRAMKAAQIETAFADLFADSLARIPLDGSAEELAWRIRLLAPTYETASHSQPQTRGKHAFLAAVAQGIPTADLAHTGVEQAIAAAFGPESAAPHKLQRLLDNGQLGESILRAMDLFARGADGNLGDLTDALTTFRAVGLEDTARRAALQLLLLDRR
ncbi:hypothetical protein [Phaeobacter porticola]|uniref:Antifreeze glycopeptide polyprotein n=1 Tax=Phaeobacter porticola TaxID=1844006 RepID=A0A1L3I3V2_9RHOB|nr:hypothetical protein [Phaeobacter porticola]APG46825.1 hypothetical protein PhaeoP97_01404 [Phaeobacter porticola]